MTDRVRVARRMFVWARQRSGRTVADLARRFPKLADWESGTAAPTMRQLEEYAQATHTPVGYFFLDKPPVETVPIPDFRTFENKRVATPTPDLLDTIYACEQRQEWYREFAEAHGADPVELVGNMRVSRDVIEAATQMRDPAFS